MNTMNKNTVLIGVVIAILLAAGVAFMVRGQSQAPSQQKPVAKTGTTTTTTETSEKRSIKELMGLGMNQQCTFQDTVSGNSGSIYTANGKYRGDFTSTVNGVASGTHMFSDGQDTYIWMDGQKNGFKMSMAALEKADTTNPSVPKTVDVNQQLDYTCVPWNSNAVTLDLPKDVEFTDFSSMMQKLIPTVGTTTNTNAGDAMMGAPTSGCGICDSLSGDEKSQCKTALSCP